MTFFLIATKFTYTPRLHSPQKYTHHEAAGFDLSPAASFVLCLYRSRILGRCSESSAGSRRCASKGGYRRVRGSRGFCGGWKCEYFAWSFGLVECTVEGVIEDVGGGLDGAWEAVATILVLELDAVGGVVGIGDFTADVGDDDGDGAAVRLDDVGVLREEKLGVMGGFFLGEHGGLNLVFVGGLVIVEGGGAERGGGGAVKGELALGDA